MPIQLLGLLALLVWQTDRLVPESLLEAARANPYTFVHLLSQTGVPAGLELREADRPRRGDFRPQWQPEALAKQDRIPLAMVLTEFNKSQRAYRAELVDGVINVRPAERRSAYLDSPAITGTIRERGLMNVASRLFEPLSATKSVAGGRISVLSSPVGVDIDRGENIDVALEATDKPVVQLLNEIIARTTQQAWLVVTSEMDAAQLQSPRVVRFGFIHQHWTTTERPIQPATTSR
jgi:hypothetical protein